MITIETHRNNWKKWRPRVFTFLTVFLSIVLLVAGTFECIPAWILRNPPDAIHLWHIAELTALSAILVGGAMFGLVRKPEEKPLLAQFIVQITGMTEQDAHALQFHWIGSALLYVLLILAGVLASTKRPGWKRLAIVTGITYIFLAGIALLVLVGHMSRLLPLR